VTGFQIIWEIERKDLDLEIKWENLPVYENLRDLNFSVEENRKRFSRVHRLFVAIEEDSVLKKHKIKAQK
jgi:hypothetical protein